MRVSGRRLPVLVAVAILTLSGCGGSGEQSAQPSESTPPPTDAPSQTTSSDAGAPTPSQPDDKDASPVETDDGAVEIEVEIEHGQVTPSGERVDVEVGQPVRFKVDSDVADEIHVHSIPEHTFGFRAGADDREFEFTLSQPGVVEAELHELGDVVVTLAARP